MLWWSGKTDGDIAACMRCTIPTVTKWRTQYGLKGNTRADWYYAPDVLQRAGIVCGKSKIQT